MTADAEATPESTPESVADTAASDPVAEDVMPTAEPDVDTPVEGEAETEESAPDEEVESGEPEASQPEVSEPEAEASVFADVPPASSKEPWGKVDEDGTVSVREAAGWRVVGQYPDGSAEEALAYFERKYSDLASEVGLLEVRHHRGGASASDIRSAARIVEGKLKDAAAVGDLASLEARVAKLSKALSAASATEAAASREAVDAAVRERTELVEKAEALAARDPKSAGIG